MVDDRSMRQLSISSTKDLGRVQRDYDEEACDEAKTHWYDSFWRAKHPGGYQDTIWEGDCFVDDLRSMRCEQGAVPYYTAAVRSVEDVQVAVEFARKHRLRTRIKGVCFCFHIGNVNEIVYLSRLITFAGFS